MVRKLIVLLAVLAPAAVSLAFVVTGHISGGAGFAIRYVYAVPVVPDTFLFSVALPPSYNYGISGLQAGGHIIFAYQDVNFNFTPDPEEPRGFWGGQTPVPLVVMSDTSGIDIALQPPNSGGFSGDLSYSGSSTGLTLVIAHRTPTFTDAPRGFGIVLDNSGSGGYTAFVDSFGVYYAYAYMDLNSNMQHDAAEPYGVYGGATPQAITIWPTNFPDDINITLSDPLSAPPPRRGLPEEAGIAEIYPNPFNAVAVVTFTLPSEGRVRLSAYDVLGREATILASGQYPAGDHQVIMKAEDMPSGLYFVTLVTDRGSVIRRVLLMR